MVSIPSPARPDTAAEPALSNLPLTLQFLECVARQPRTYRETMEAWQTHCPRFTIWEDAHALGLVRTVRSEGSESGSQVMLTDAGRTFLAENAQRSSRSVDMSTSGRVRHFTLVMDRISPTSGLR